ncbi:MAG: alpha/beta fold hydrolase [Nocardioidaceae bacterium]|jgi:pimeloyl-ACP methyl ester carboxylesterase|nr:alpha/beta fold hydrolase [Nocardioidaceae bacterium]
MPWATNPRDGVRSYFEDTGGDGSPVLVYTGLADPLEEAQQNPLVRALAYEHRMVFADHRGHGRSDKPHDVDSYALPTRVLDAVAVLDQADVERAHVLGFSWGARLGFAIGEHAPERALSLVLCGNQPYAWEERWPFVPMLSEALDAAQHSGMQGFLDTLESTLSDALGETVRRRLLDNDPRAIGAAWRSAMSEGAISRDLTAWRLPCLIYMAGGEEMYANAARAAAEIPTARFLALSGHTHLSAPYEVEQVLPAVRALFAAAAPLPP